MDRLSTLDAEFLHLEDGIQHLHIAGVCIFEGPKPAVADLRRLIASRLHVIPRYRQRARSVPLELGRPVWVDDPHFALDHHVLHTALPQPGDRATLERLMARLVSHPLDRERPLWETWLVEGLEDDRWALICKIHHSIVDGVSGVDLLTALLSAERDEEIGEPVPWEPEPEPSGSARVLNAWGGLASDLGALLGAVPGAVAHPADTARGAMRLGQGLLTFARHLDTVPPLSIEGSIGPHRVWSTSSVSIADIKKVRTAFGGTLNDVVLAVLAGGYRKLLQAHGDDVDAAVVRTLVPVSTRPLDAHGQLDNQVSAMLCELPVQLEDPVDRLADIGEQMAELKASHMAEAGGLVITIGDIVPPMVVGTVSRAATRLLRNMPQRSVTTVTTNVPGPQFPIYCLGREMLEYLPFVPIAHGVRVGTAILSYNGTVAFGVTGDDDTAPDIELITTTAREELEAMVQRARGHAPAPVPSP
jgi:WS/DGAT/MGAT family acyltransferase